MGETKGLNQTETFATRLEDLFSNVQGGSLKQWTSWIVGVQNPDLINKVPNEF